MLCSYARKRGKKGSVQIQSVNLLKVQISFTALLNDKKQSVEQFFHLSCFDMVTPRTLNTLHLYSVYVEGKVCFVFCSPEVSDHLFCLSGVRDQVIVLVLFLQMIHLEPVGRFIPV